MASLPFSPPPGFDDLSVDEKLDYLQALWGRIASRPEQVPVPEWHRQILGERIAAYRAGKGSTRPWSEFRRELRALLDRRDR